MRNINKLFQIPFLTFFGMSVSKRGTRLGIALCIEVFNVAYARSR